MKIKIEWVKKAYVNKNQLPYTLLYNAWHDDDNGSKQTLNTKIIAGIGDISFFNPFNFATLCRYSRQICNILSNYSNECQ